jgi:diguanylate cyclase (GGDEF)-like protein
MENSLDFLDKALWKKIQDSFAKPFGALLYTVDTLGREITCSADFPFFCQIVKSTEKGKKSCQLCREKFLKQTENNTIVFSCHAGLLNILTPISIKGQKVGAIICGGLRIEKSNMEVNKLSTALNIESEELLDALSSLKITDQGEIQNYSNLLSIFSKTIPELVYQKKISDRRIEELDILHKISHSISQMTSLDKTLELIKKSIKRLAYISGCSILLTGMENCGSKQVERVVQEEVLKTKTLVSLKNLDKYPKLKRHYFPYHLIGLPITLSNNVIGTIIYYVFSLDKVTREDLSFLWILADQVSFAVLNAQNLEKIRSKAITDQLTKLYNREYFMNLLERDIMQDISPLNPLSLALIDIDDFKHYNDKHGHVKGDELLQKLAGIIRLETKEIIGRYGGEEFIIISPGTKSNVALDNLEAVRKKIESTPFFGKEDQPLGKVTISAGLVTSLDNSFSAIELIKEADRSLYKAKAQGKNRIKSTVLVKKDLYAVDVQKADGFHKPKCA